MPCKVLAAPAKVLPLLTSPVVTLALTLLLLQPVQAQQSQRRVSLPNQDYTESTQDLAVKVAGGRAVINRTWSWGRWYLNDAWADLSLRSAPYMSASPGQTAPIIAIGRAERIYKRVTAATLAAAEAGKASTARQDCHAALAAGAVKAGDIWRLNENNAIRALGQAEHITGWQWYDQAGNTIDYDAQGRMQSWSSPAGVKTSLIRDEAGRILGVKDHAGRQVISIDYGGGLLPVRVQDTEGHSVSYEWQPLPAPIQASGNAAAALAHARLLKASDARGGVWHYEYSAGGHISRRTDPEGGQIKLEYYPVSVDTITTSEVSVALTLDKMGSAASGNSLLSQELIEELSQFCTVKVDTGLSLVALIGNELHTASGVAKRIFETLDAYNIRMISYGASTNNICLLADSDKADDIVRLLHKALFE